MKENRCMKSLSSFAGRVLRLLSLYALCSCRNKQDNAVILQQVDEGLVQSNRLIRLLSNDILQAIEQKTYDRPSAERAKEIYPKAMALQNKTDSIFAYIEGLGTLLNRDDATGLVSKRIEELYTKLDDYKREILSLDERMSNDLSGTIFIVSKESDSSQIVPAALKENLQDSPAAAAKAFLHRIENNLAIDEQKAMSFLHYRTVVRRDDYAVFEAIVGQNAQVLEAGRTLEIIAGMGSFTKYPIAQITVDGHLIPLNEKGLAIYQLKTLIKPGNYSIPVKIAFTDPDGKEQIRTITVGYKTLSSGPK